MTYWRQGGCFLLLFTVLTPAQASTLSGTAPFVLDGNRIYAELSFVRSDGSSHRALAFVDMGSPSTTVSTALFKELQLDLGKPLVFRVGAFSVSVPSSEVTIDPSKPRSPGGSLPVEATLPASVMQKYDVTLDYRRRTLTFAVPGTVKPKGVPVPFGINEKTGLIEVNAIVDGESYPVTIDNGSAFTWFRQDTVRTWLVAHPGWLRGVGAVGPSNMMMSGDGAEASGILARVPEIDVGTVALRQVGVLGAAAGKGMSENMDLFDWYSTKNVIPVIGWIGGNVLKAFRLTIDYRHRTIYFERQSAPDVSDFDQVGITLRREAGRYVVAGIAAKGGQPTVEGVELGDTLVRIDGYDTFGATMGRIYSLLHGRPGETRLLVLERGTNQLAVRASVTAF
jgi:hypothetical protein